MKKVYGIIGFLVVAACGVSQCPRIFRLQYMNDRCGSISTVQIQLCGLYHDTVSHTWVMEDCYNPGSFKKDDRWMYSISINDYHLLKQTGTLMFDGRPLYLMSDCAPHVYDINGKLVNALVAEDNTGRTKIWILDNPSLPLLLKTEGCGYNGDIELVDMHGQYSFQQPDELR